MKQNNPGWKTTELWLIIITGLVSIAPTPTTTILIICLAIAAVTYLLCRTVFKIARLKYRPDEVAAVASPPAYLLCRTVFKIAKLKYRPNEAIDFSLRSFTKPTEISQQETGDLASTEVEQDSSKG